MIINQTFEDCRVTREVMPRVFDGGVTCDPGGGEVVTYRQFLGESFFEHLAILKALGDTDMVRVTFWFDN